MNRISEIRIKVIPHNNQRYETVGDWFYQGDAENPGHFILHICVSKLEDNRHELLIALHELVEVILCNAQGVTQAAVDKFDMDFEKAREEGDDSEPGDAISAPYQNQHCFATAVERMLCAALGISWVEYENGINALTK